MDRLHEIAFRTAQAFEGFKPPTGRIWRRLRVLDRERTVATLDRLERYLRELRRIVPSSLEEY